MNLSPTQIIPLLADTGVYLASESTFYRILKKNKLLAHRGKSKAKSFNKPMPIIATGPNQVWSWDITYLRGPIKGQFFYLYMFMDIWSRKIVGQKVYECESMEYSSDLFTSISDREDISKDQLILHSDNGGPMKGATMLATLKYLGVAPSFSRPRVSDDNPFSESLFKTLKYCPDYPDAGFSSIEAAQSWCNRFVSWYNYKHLHSETSYVTPGDRHDGRDIEILNKRDLLYQKSRNGKPSRWSKSTRNWSHIKKVYLNHLQEEKEIDMKMVS